MEKNFLIYLPGGFHNCGGVVCLFELCKILCEFGVNAKIKSNYFINNPICNNYYENDFPIDENCIVIYPEIYEGNPLNAKNVIRWILAPLGTFFSLETTINSWGKNDLVYYYNSELKFNSDSEKIGTVYKLLNCIYIYPKIKIFNFDKRKGVCHYFGKTQFHKKITHFHPHNSLEIITQPSQDEYIEIFNNHKFFICYDPLTFMIIISALCGCIPILHKIEGLNKNKWLETQAIFEYLKYKGLDNLYGIAYGEEDIKYAEETIHLVKEQWDDVVNFCKQKTILPFIQDMENLDNLKNTVENNYFLTPSEI